MPEPCACARLAFPYALCMNRMLTVSAVSMALLGCQGKQPAPTPASSLTQIDSSLPSPERFAEQFPAFESYWHQGKDELTRYSLRQAHYGDTHDVEAVLVFVTEDYLTNMTIKQQQ